MAPRGRNYAGRQHRLHLSPQAALLPASPAPIQEAVLPYYPPVLQPTPSTSLGKGPDPWLSQGRVAGPSGQKATGNATSRSLERRSSPSGSPQTPTRETLAAIALVSARKGKPNTCGHAFTQRQRAQLKPHAYPGNATKAEFGVAVRSQAQRLPGKCPRSVSPQAAKRRCRLCPYRSAPAPPAQTPIAIIPPSTHTYSPVMNEARSLARNRTTFATSSGIPIRPSGWVLP